MGLPRTAVVAALALLPLLALGALAAPTPARPRGRPTNLPVPAGTSMVDAMPPEEVARRVEAIIKEADPNAKLPRANKQRPAAPRDPRSSGQVAYTGVLDFVSCTADKVLRPASTAELAADIAEIRKRAADEGRPLKLRASHNHFGSTVPFPCPSGLVGADGKPPLLVAVVMDRMTKVLSVDKAAARMNVQAQMAVRDLVAAVKDAGLATPRSTLPWWAELTLAGVLSTTAHGTGFNVTHQLCNYVLNVTWVDAAGSVHNHGRDTDEVRAMCGGVGVLGVITELALQLTPPTNTRLSTPRYLSSDANLTADIDELLKISPHLIITWRPDLGLYAAHLQQPAPDNATVITGARATLLPAIQPPADALFGPALRLWQGDPWNNKPLTFALEKGICLINYVYSAAATWASVAVKGNTTRYLLEGVVPTNDITSVDCQQECTFANPAVDSTTEDVHFGIEKAQLAGYISDVKALISKDLKGTPGLFKEKRCLPPGWYVIRFGAPTDNLLAMGAGLKQPVFVQDLRIASKGTPGLPNRYEWVQEAWEQMLLCKYEGRPHFGKNWPRTFTHPTCKLAPRYGDGFAKIAQLQAIYDPGHAFEPEMFRRAATGEAYKLTPRCALKHECFCQADEHCADGFVCTPSLALPQFKVCKPAKIH